MITITREFGFDAGHRLMQHESRCRHVHGHRYTAHVTVASSSAQELDAVGRVVDFGVLKAKVGAWIDENWDHAFLAQEGDPIIEWLEENESACYILPHPPSAERLAEFLFARADELLQPDGLFVVEVICHETPNCSATVSRPDRIRMEIAEREPEELHLVLASQSADARRCVACGFTPKTGDLWHFITDQAKWMAPPMGFRACCKEVPL